MKLAKLLPLFALVAMVAPSFAYDRDEVADAHNTVNVTVYGSYNDSTFKEFGNDGCKFKARAWRNQDGTTRMKVQTKRCAKWEVVDTEFSYQRDYITSGGAEGYNYEGTITLTPSATWRSSNLRIRWSSPDGNFTTISYLHF